MLPLLLLLLQRPGSKVPLIRLLLWCTICRAVAARAHTQPHTIWLAPQSIYLLLREWESMTAECWVLSAAGGGGGGEGATGQWSALLVIHKLWLVIIHHCLVPRFQFLAFSLSLSVCDPSPLGAGHSHRRRHFGGCCWKAAEMSTQTLATCAGAATFFELHSHLKWMSSVSQFSCPSFSSSFSS